MKIFRKLIAGLLVCVSLASTIVFAENNNVTVTLNGAPIVFDVQPEIINNRTMVPFRKIGESLGAHVAWNEDTRSVLMVKGDDILMLQIDNPKLFKSDSEFIELDTAPIIVSGRTLVPLRAISESFGISVDWDDATKTVILTTPQTEVEVEAEPQA